MLDIKFIRENLDLVKEGAKRKRLDVDFDKLISLDDDRLKILASVEKKRARQNQVSDEIAKADANLRETLIGEMKILKEELQTEEEQLKQVIKDWQSVMVLVPNIPDMSVPEGDDDSQNLELKTWGGQPKFDFSPKNQLDLLLDLQMVDFERGSKVSGFRGYFLKNDGALLSLAIWQYSIDQLAKKGYQPLLVPSLVRPDSFFGTGYLPQGEEDLYKTQDGEYLAGTAEVATMGLYMDEILPAERLPKKFVSFSPCFRREAGSHGKDTKGLIRVHEFYKVEQVIICPASHEESVKYHEELLANAEELMQSLGIPYRVVVNCTGDLGLGQVKKYDIEAWVPSENRYRETHSISYFHDFQTRRLNLKYKDGDGKIRLAHSLNGTAFATPRLLVSIVENNQQSDGSVLVPEVLRPYLGKDVIK